MNIHERDQERHKVFTELEAKKPCVPCDPKERDFFHALMDGVTYRSVGLEIKNVLAAADLSHEESIVVGIVTLVRASKLPHQAILEAVSACLDPESSDHKNQAGGPAG